MNDQKYFALIKGPQIKKAPGLKIIPQNEFEELLSSKEVLEKVQEDATEYRKKITAECEIIKEKAEKEGFAAGYEAWVAQIDGLEKEIAKVREEMMKLIMPIALKAAKKIVSRELDVAPEVIMDIVKGTLKAVAQHKKIVLYINKRDFETIDKNKSGLKQIFEQLESLSVRERDDIEPGGCIVETESGIINAQLKDRWVSLEAAFSSLGSQLLKGM